MSRLHYALRLFPPGSIVTPAMMKDHKDMQRMIDNDPNYYFREGCYDRHGKPITAEHVNRL